MIIDLGSDLNNYLKTLSDNELKDIFFFIKPETYKVKPKVNKDILFTPYSEHIFRLMKSDDNNFYIIAEFFFDDYGLKNILYEFTYVISNEFSKQLLSKMNSDFIYLYLENFLGYICANKFIDIDITKSKSEKPREILVLLDHVILKKLILK